MKFHAAILVMMLLGSTLPAMYDPNRFREAAIMVGLCIAGYISGAILEYVR